MVPLVTKLCLFYLQFTETTLAHSYTINSLGGVEYEYSDRKLQGC